MRTCERWQIPNSSGPDQPFFQLYRKRVNKPLKRLPVGVLSTLHHTGNREAAIGAIDVPGHK